MASVSSNPSHPSHPPVSGAVGGGEFHSIRREAEIFAPSPALNVNADEKALCVTSVERTNELDDIDEDEKEWKGEIYPSAAASSSSSSSSSPYFSSSFEFLRSAFSIPFSRPDSSATTSFQQRFVSLFQRRLDFEKMEHKYGPGVANYYFASFYLPILYLICFIISIGALAQDVDGKKHEKDVGHINSFAAVSYCAAVAGNSFASPLLQFGLAAGAGFIIFAFPMWLRKRMDRWAVRRDQLKRGVTPQPEKKRRKRAQFLADCMKKAYAWMVTNTPLSYFLQPTEPASSAPTVTPAATAAALPPPINGQTPLTIPPLSSLSTGYAHPVPVSSPPGQPAISARHGEAATSVMMSASQAHHQPLLVHAQSLPTMTASPHTTRADSAFDAAPSYALSIAHLPSSAHSLNNSPAPSSDSAFSSPSPFPTSHSPALSDSPSLSQYPLSFFYTSPSDFTVMVRGLRPHHTDPIALCKYFNEVLRARVSSVSILLTSPKANSLTKYRAKVISQIANVRLRKSAFVAKKEVKSTLKQMVANSKSPLLTQSSSGLQHAINSTGGTFSRQHSRMNTAEGNLQATADAVNPQTLQRSATLQVPSAASAGLSSASLTTLKFDETAHIKRNSHLSKKQYSSLDSSTFPESSEWRQLCDEEKSLMATLAECEDLLVKDPPQCCGTAFVTFSHRSTTIRALNLFASSFMARVLYYVCCLFCCYRGPPRFDGVRLSVEEAASPSDIIWSSFQLNWCEKIGRRIITFYCGFFMAGLGIFAAVTATQAVTSDAVARGAISAVFVIVKLCLFFLFNRLSRYESHKHHSSTQLNTMTRIGFVQVAFTVCVLYGVNHTHLVLDNDVTNSDNLPCDWWAYAASSVMIAAVSDALMTPMMHFVRPFETVEHAYYNIVGNDLEETLFTRPFTLVLHNRFANFIYSFFITIWFGPVFPLVYLISCIGRILCYLVDKYNLLYTDRFVPRYDERMARTTFWLIGFALIAQQVFFLIVASSDIFIVFSGSLLTLCAISLAVEAWKYIHRKFFQTKYLQPQVTDDLQMDYRTWARWRRQLREEEERKEEPKHKHKYDGTGRGLDSLNLNSNSKVFIDEAALPITSRANPDAYIPSHEWQHRTVHYELPPTPRPRIQTLHERVAHHTANEHSEKETTHIATAPMKLKNEGEVREVRP